MHRTQIYFEEQFFEAIKKKARNMNISVSAYIRVTVQKDLQTQKQQPADFSEFSGMWQDYDVSLESIRKKAWK